MALIHMNFVSKYLFGSTDVNIVLPDLAYGQDPKEFYGSGKKYKVIWLLHGTFGDYSDWLRKSNAELYACEHDLVLVMPSAQNTNYTDWKTFGLGYNVYSYLTEELMPMVYGWLPVSDKREDNFIAGLSMGGRGALEFAYNHPEKFQAAYIMSSVPTELNKPDPSSPFYQREINLINNAGGMEGYLASPLNVWDLTKKVSIRDDMPQLTFACGDADPLMYKNFLKFRDYAKECGLEAVFKEYEGFSHEWRFWDLCLQDAISVFLGEEED